MQDAGLQTSYLQGIRPDVSGGPKGRQAADGDLGFDDLIDAVNPLQHMPGVSMLYREVTGDTIKAPMKVVGGALIGGPLGFLGAVADVVLEELTGRDFGGHVMALFDGGEADPAASPVQVAKHKPSVTIDVMSAKPAEESQNARIDAAEAPPPPASLRQLAEAEEAEVPSAPVQPVQLSALDAASSYESSQIPRELMESLYRMHQNQYMQMMQGEQADRRF